MNLKHFRDSITTKIEKRRILEKLVKLLSLFVWRGDDFTPTEI